ncbi:4'-phosphopantetheinyl transferase superfamily protein [Pleurocapsales cyanobacterium LEGE 06147]|nr:4'-phosphopantetheinyl transferase superfamily protein [Pleurocapsales cyanobacterium LEGE 06147]
MKPIFKSFTKKTDIKGIGVDLISVHRIAKLIDHYNFETLTLLFTCSELNYCRSANNSNRAYALSFGIKEAVGKALTTGLVGIDWNEIEVDLTNERPKVFLHGKAEIKAKNLGIRQWLVNWWDLDCHVLAHVIAI